MSTSARRAASAWQAWRDARRTRILRARAIEYAAHGWPVLPLAVPGQGGRQCACGSDCAAPHVIVRTGLTDTAVVTGIWDKHGWDVALSTAQMDVLELPASRGAPLHLRLKTDCPTAFAPRRRRWYFFLVPGSVSVELAARSGGDLHSGPDGWVPAPGTRTAETGRVRWLEPPYETGWAAYLRQDDVDAVLTDPGRRDSLYPAHRSLLD